MRYISDDGKIQGTKEEVEQYEERQKFDGEIAEQIGKYLDSCVVWVKDDASSTGKSSRNLNGREFSRRETVIKDWIRWDRQHRPERYETKESDEPAVNVVTGAA